MNVLKYMEKKEITKKNEPVPVKASKKQPKIGPEQREDYYEHNTPSTGIYDTDTRQ